MLVGRDPNPANPAPHRWQELGLRFEHRRQQLATPGPLATFALAAILLIVAAGLRLWALAPLSMHHPDEIFQYLEPAHRIAFGDGVRTWEYRFGMRGWLLPVLLSWPMLLGNQIAPDSGLYLLLPRLIVAALSLTIPCSAFVIGYRMSRAHALVAMAVTSVWFETVYFSAHVLSEQISISLFMPAAALMLIEGMHARRRYAVAGLFLGLAVAMRFHNGPAIVAFVLTTCGRDVRDRWLPLTLGATVALAMSAMADLSQGVVPFSWIIANLDQNIVQDQAAKFGTRSPIHYLGLLAGHWRWALPLMVLAVRSALGRNRALFVTAVVHIVLLSLIPHKEYRFILLSTTLLVLLAAFGSVDLVRAWSAGRSQRLRVLALGILVMAWCATSAILAASPMMKARWTEHAPELNLMVEARGLPKLCGIALYQQRFWQTGGYTHLHRDRPLYLTHPTAEQGIADADVETASAAFDVVIAPALGISAFPRRYHIVSCSGAGLERMCLLQRSGGCRPSAATRWALPAVLSRLNL